VLNQRWCVDRLCLSQNKPQRQPAKLRLLPQHKRLMQQRSSDMMRRRLNPMQRQVFRILPHH
jgi:hypothetical protein